MFRSGENTNMEKENAQHRKNSAINRKEPGRARKGPRGRPTFGLRPKGQEGWKPE